MLQPSLWPGIPGPRSDIVGYMMHYGTSTEDYDYNVDVGNITNCTISGLEEGTIYYFGATAYNNSDNESIFTETY